MRDLDKNPYSPDEKRVVAFFNDRGLGGGDDPIEFLLSSYHYVVEQRNDAQNCVANVQDYLEQALELIALMKK